MMMVKIYAIKDAQGVVVYVGSTKRDLEKRYAEHLKDSTHLEKVKYLKNNCKIVLLEEVNINFSNPKEIEQKYINKYNPVFNRIDAKDNKEEKYKRAYKRCLEIIKNLNSAKHKND